MELIHDYPQECSFYPRDLTAGRTAIIITHRFTTAMQADMIHVMDVGKSSNRAAMRHSWRRYAQSWRAQMEINKINMANQAQKWLLSCLRGEQEKIKERSAEQWQELIQQAARFSVIPMLYPRFRNINIPDEIGQRLQQAYRRNGSFEHDDGNLSRLECLKHLSQLFVEAHVIKPFLAPVVYDNIAIRTMNDADLLVRKEDLARAKEEMLALGYLPEATGGTSHQHLPPFYRQTSPEDKAPSKGIEIHWTILAENSPFEIDIEGLWQRAQPVKIANVEVLGLSPEDLLAHHASYQHRFAFGVRPFCDISLTIKHYQEQLDWQTLVQRAHLWRVNKVIYLTLLLCQDLLNAPIPPHALSALKPANLPHKLVIQAKEQLFADKSQQPKIVRQTARISGADGLLDKARLASESLFLPPEVMARMYPVRPGSLRMYLYYLVRLKYLLGQHGSQVWQLLVRREEKIVSPAEREYALLEWLSSV